MMLKLLCVLWTSMQHMLSYSTSGEPQNFYCNPLCLGTTSVLLLFYLEGIIQSNIICALSSRVNSSEHSHRNKLGVIRLRRRPQRGSSNRQLASYSTHACRVIRSGHTFLKHDDKSVIGCGRTAPPSINRSGPT